MRRSNSPGRTDQQRMHRRVEAELLRPYSGTSCTCPSVTNTTPASSVERRVGQRAVEIGEQVVAGAPSAGRPRRLPPRRTRAPILPSLPASSAQWRRASSRPSASAGSRSGRSTTTAILPRIFALLLPQFRVGQRQEGGPRAPARSKSAARAPRQNRSATSTAASQRQPPEQGTGSNGAISIDQFM